MTDPIQLQEIQQIHEYIRHCLAVYVTWFTFLLVFLFGAMAWSLKAATDKQGTLRRTTPFFFALTLFAFQLALGIYFTSDLRSEIALLDERALSLQRELASAQLQIPYNLPLRSPAPASIHLAFQLMHWTLISQLVFWLAAGLYVALRRGKKVFASSLSDAAG